MAQRQISQSTESTVSWQSAFWALVAVMLNACLQDAGQILKIDKTYAIFFRTSPIFCLLDSLSLLAEILWYGLHHGWQESIQQVYAARQETRSVTSAHTPAGAKAAYILLTVVGVLQSVKVFCCTGLPWIQFFAACFVFSYTTNALLSYFATSTILSTASFTTYTSTTIVPSAQTSNTMCRILRSVATACQMTILIFTTWHTDSILFRKQTNVPEMDVKFSQDVSNKAVGMTLSILALYGLAAGAGFIAGIVSVSKSVLIGSIAALVYLLLIAQGILNFTYYSGLGFDVLKFCQPVIAAATTVLFLVLVVFSLSSFVLFVDEKIHQPRPPKSRHTFRHTTAGWTFLISNVLLTLYYFSLGYDPTGTFKPKWAENLG